MSLTKVSAYSTHDAMLEQKTGKLGKEGHDSLDNIIRQAVGREPFFSFSRAGESPIQWIQLLHALDQQGSTKVSNGPRIDNTGKERQLDHCNGVSSFASEINGVKEPEHSMKGSGIPAKVTKSPSGMQTLKIPEAVVAFAQAAAKANGEPEKYLPGWPLLSPSKVLLQKCDKCSREFCSPVNYRRHIRVHRRSLNVDKASPKNRELLAAFWDKLSLDEAEELVSFKNVNLEEVTGSSIIRALTSLIQKPGFSSLPQVYVKAGATLLDVVQARPSKFPISSHELFSILDDASEKTFLCAGTAISLQKFVFDGEVGKIATEMKNLVACTSFLLEQKLVKAWVADKDAEALRCQKLLVEEEEAAQKRKAELLERRRMKKLRQKEQKTKEQIYVNKVEFKEGLLDAVVGTSFSAKTLSPKAPSETDLDTLSPKAPSEASLDSSQPVLEPTQSFDPCMEADVRCYLRAGDADQVDPRVQQGTGRRQQTVPRHPISKPTRNAPSGFHSQVVTKTMVVQKQNSYKNPKPTTLANAQKVWTRKSKPESEEEDSDCRERVEKDGIENCEVLIGSISVTLGDCNGHQQELISVRQTNVHEKPVKTNSSLNSVNRPTMKLWRPVGREDKIGFPNKAASLILRDQSCLADGEMVGCSTERTEDSLSVPESANLSVPRLFSSKAAEAFLAQRWKEAIAFDHVKLVLSPETEAKSMVHIDTSEETFTEAPPQPINCSGRSILSSAEKGIARVGSIEPTATSVYKPKLRAKPENTYD